MPPIYLDHNATTPLHPSVMESVNSLANLPLNASSIHAFGRRARQLLEEARRRVMLASDSDPSIYRLVFTATGTEANNLALKGGKGRLYQRLLVSAIEHPSILKAAEHFTTIPVTSDGVVQLDALETLLAKTPATRTLISVMLANNETGVIQPIEEIVTLAKRYDALVHCDAVQAFGKIPFSLTTLDVDLLTLSAHKIGGMQGAAALIFRKKLHLASEIHGGGQEQGARAGTENILALHAFGLAAEMIDTTQYAATITPLRDKLEDSLMDAHIVGKNANRLPNTSCILLPRMKAETQLIHFDLQGIAVSSGSACSSGRVTVSHVLTAMDYPLELAECAIRVSLGRTTTEEEIAAFVKAWETVYNRALR